MHALYTLAARLLAPLFVAVLLWRGLADRGYWHGLHERLGFGTRAPRPGLWVHAVSAGEVQACAPLVAALIARYPHLPLTVTTATPAGASRARALFGPSVDVRYVPFDLPGAARRFLERIQPRAGVILETELWPNLYRVCRARRVPLLLASARLSERSSRNYRHLGSLFATALSGDVVVAAQTEADARRFVELGADPARVHVSGNLKFDFPIAPQTRSAGQALRARHALQRGAWTAGSTHEVEEQAVLSAHAQVRKAHPGALLILAPRHARRFGDVARWLEQNGTRFVRQSRGEVCGADTEVLLLDTLGELLDFYAASDLAYVGGSLVSVGGHNLLEPASLGLSVLSGPHNFSAPEIARLLSERGAVQIVRDGADLGRHVTRLLSQPAERARRGGAALQVVEENRGALARVLALMGPLVSAESH